MEDVLRDQSESCSLTNGDIHGGVKTVPCT